MLEYSSLVCCHHLVLMSYRWCSQGVKVHKVGVYCLVVCLAVADAGREWSIFLRNVSPNAEAGLAACLYSGRGSNLKVKVGLFSVQGHSKLATAIDTLTSTPRIRMPTQTALR